MIQYHELCKHILENGTIKQDRTGTGTISVFGYQMRFDLGNGFPLLTTKKVHYKSIFHELLWFVSGSTNIKYLVDNDVRIWNEWPFETYKKSSDYQKETLVEFAKKIKSDISFAEKHGDLGPVYGKQWRDFDGVDQLQNLIDQIKSTPDSRRLIMSAWNPPLIDQMALPPCHTLIQFYVINNKLSLQLYQRSGDVFLGIPFNIASYALLLAMVAHVTSLDVGEFIHTIGDAHLYLNHLDQVKLQLTRTPKKLPSLWLNRKKSNLFEFTYKDISIKDYVADPHIKGVVAI